MDGHVIPEFLTGLATLTALLTSERKLTAVHHHVNPESIGPGKSKSDHYLSSILLVFTNKDRCKKCGFFFTIKRFALVVSDGLLGPPLPHLTVLVSLKFS